MGTTNLNKKGLDEIMKESGHSTTEISWYTGISVEELDLCVAGLYVMPQQLETIVKKYLGNL